MASVTYLYTRIDIFFVTLQRVEIGSIDNRAVQHDVVGINLLRYKIYIMVADTPRIAVGKGDRRELLFDRVDDRHGGVAKLPGTIASLQVEKDTHRPGTFEVEARIIRRPRHAQLSALVRVQHERNVVVAHLRAVVQGSDFEVVGRP